MLDLRTVFAGSMLSLALAGLLVLADRVSERARVFAGAYGSAAAALAEPNPDKALAHVQAAAVAPQPMTSEEAHAQLRRNLGL